MNIISNNTSNKTNTTTIILVNINDIILPAIYLFLTKKNTRFEVLWPQFYFLE